MTKIKLCGMMRECDIEYANEIMPDYVGFVFAEKSRRRVTPDKAEMMSRMLDSHIMPVGVFVDESIEAIAKLVSRGIIRMVQLHGGEDEAYIKELRRYVSCPVIKAFRIGSAEDISAACMSSADYIMLDSGGGSGKPFDHSLIEGIDREYFLAGGLDSANAASVISRFRPFAVDVSSALETDGVKDRNKMEAFVKAVRKG